MDFTIYCDGNRAYADTQKVISAGTVGLTADFQFSDEWEGLNKIVMFKSYTKVVSVTLLSDTDSVTIPAEVLAYDGCKAWIGVCGADSAGTTVIPTLWALIGTVSGGADPSIAGNVTTPTATLEAQMMELVRNAQFAASAAASASGAEIISFSVSDEGHLIETRTNPEDPTQKTENDLGVVTLNDELSEEDLTALLNGGTLSTLSFVSARRLSTYHTATDAYCLKKSNVSNSLTEEEEGFVLDARQAKVLNDKFDTALASEVTNRNSAINTAIGSEVTARDKAVSDAINTEVANRNSAISSAISSEVTNRNSAISSSVTSAINTEVNNRNSAISTAVSKYITYGTGAMTAGSSSLTTGAIYLQYE